MEPMANAITSAFPDGMVIYQIYPRSFKDTNNDGIGDLPGIISKLDYLQSLGITAIWLNPVFTSPMADFGYDISNYREVDPLFGNLADLDHLIEQAHKRHIKIILDLVLNHTSNQHPWFKSSQASRDNQHRNWYVWRDAKPDGSPPNNWLSIFGGSAWELDKTTGQYYLHTFFREQPDLNWQNPEVRSEIKEIVRYWLGRGVDGFRLDAVHWYAKDIAFRDEPPNPMYRPKSDSPYDALKHIYSKAAPKLYPYLNELATILAEHQKGFMVMEVSLDNPLDIPEYRKFYEQVNALVAAPFNFGIMSLPWGARQFKQFINAFEKSLKPTDTPVYVSGNHDRPRLASRVGEPATRASALLQLTLPGAAVVYYGEELGMQSVPIPASYVHDSYEMNIPGLGVGRDPERTPMQWSRELNAGFSSAQPWLPVARNYQSHNVEVESKDANSLLTLYKKLIKLRINSAALQHGSYVPLDLKNQDLFGFRRQWDGHTLVIIVNFSHTETIAHDFEGKLVLSTVTSPTMNELQPYEAQIIELA
jgi:alpha-glucosidase